MFHVKWVLCYTYITFTSGARVQKRLKALRRLAIKEAYWPKPTEEIKGSEETGIKRGVWTQTSSGATPFLARMTWNYEWCLIMTYTVVELCVSPWRVVRWRVVIWCVVIWCVVVYDVVIPSVVIWCVVTWCVIQWPLISQQGVKWHRAAYNITLFNRYFL